MGQWIANNIQILIFAVFLLLSSLGWIFKQLQEQAENKRAKQQRERAMQEALRTGRIDSPSTTSTMGGQAMSPIPVASTSAPTSAEEAKERLRRLAEQRRNEIQRARDERDARKRGGPVVGMPSTTPTTGRPAGTGMPGRSSFPGPPPPPRSPASPRGPAPARPAPTRPSYPAPPSPPAPPRQPPQPARMPQPPHRPQAPRSPYSTSTTTDTGSRRQDTQRPAPTSKPQPALTPSQAGTQRAAEQQQRQQRHQREQRVLQQSTELPAIQRSLNDRVALRQAIVLNEILSKPIALREPQQQNTIG